MMDFLASLMASGSQGPSNMASMGMSTVPTDASQLRVPQMPMDISSLPKVTGENVASSVPATMSAPSASPMDGLMGALVAGGVNSMGSKKEEPEVAQAAPYRGGSQFDNPGAAALSGLRFSGGTNARGLLNG